MNSKPFVENELFNIYFSPQHTYYDFDGKLVFSFNYNIKESKEYGKTEGNVYIPLTENDLEAFLIWLHKAEKGPVEPAAFSEFSVRLLKAEEHQYFIEFIIDKTLISELAKVTKAPHSITVPFSSEDFNLLKWDLVRTSCECVLKKHNMDFTSEWRQGSECQEDLWNIEYKIQNPNFSYPVIYKAVLPYIGHYHSTGGINDETVMYSLGGRHINLESQPDSFCIEAYIEEDVNQVKRKVYDDFLSKWEDKLSFNVDSINKAGFLWKIESLSELTLDAIYKIFFENPIAEITPFYQELQSLESQLFFSLESLDKYGFMKELKKIVEPFRVSEDYPDYRVYLRRKNTPPEIKPWILLQFSSDKISLGNNLNLRNSTETREFIQSPTAFTEFMEELKKLGWEI